MAAAEAVKTYKLGGTTLDKVTAHHQRGLQLQRDIKDNLEAMWKAVDEAYPDTAGHPRQIDPTYLDHGMIFIQVHSPGDEDADEDESHKPPPVN